MKYLLFVLLLIAVLITAGCTSGNQNTVVTPTQVTQPLSVVVTTISQPTPTSDAVGDAVAEQAKHDAAFASPVATPMVIPVLDPLLPLPYASESPTQKCKDTMACITRPDSEPLNRTCADTILPLLRREFGTNPCFKPEEDWYVFQRDTANREFARCTKGQGELNICFDVIDAINIGYKQTTSKEDLISYRKLVTRS